ncbi:MAG TPA: enoyl-CoA hydratase-related protein [Chloroflexota bacterium]
MNDQTDVLVERRGAVGLVTLHRPEALNALSTPLMARLADALEGLERDADVRAIVVSGGPQAFAAGADVAELARRTPAEFVLEQPFAMWDRVRRITKPLVAAVRGHALGGGCELALVCDLIVAAEDARFGLPEVKLGLIPGWGGTQRLARLLGPQRALEIVLLGRTFTAGEAAEWGLVNRVVPAERVLSEALALADSLAQQPPVAVRLAKQVVRLALETPLEAGLAIERTAFFVLFGTEDAREGLQAFLEKRRPTFPGR